MILTPEGKRLYRSFLQDCTAKENDAVQIGIVKYGLELCSRKLAPELLFRYRPPSEYAFDDLEQGMVAFSHPSVFEDQEDSLPHYCLEKLDSVISEMSDPKRAKPIIDSIDFEKLSEIAISCGRELSNDAVESIKGATGEELSSRLAKVGNEVHNVSLATVVPMLQKRSRACCRILRLTRDGDNERMWARYAAEHSGFLLAYRSEDIRRCDEDINRQRAELLPLLYDDWPFNAEPQLQWTLMQSMGFDIANDDIFSDLKAIYRKGSAYEWEDEWRARLVPQKSEIDQRFVQRDCPPAFIVLGRSMSNADRGRCVRAAEAHGAPCHEEQSRWGLYFPCLCILPERVLLLVIA